MAIDSHATEMYHMAHFVNIIIRFIKVFSKKVCFDGERDARISIDDYTR